MAHPVWGLIAWSGVNEDYLGIMSAIDELLDGFSDQELQSFIHYRLSAYTPSTQERIRAYVIRRRGTMGPVLLSSAHARRAGACPRCGSSKVKRSTVEKWNTSYSEGSGLLATGSRATGILEECVVCGHCIQDPNTATGRFKVTPWFLGVIRRLFGS